MAKKNENGSGGCQMPTREGLFGVKMNSGISAKIVDEAKFSNWSWWLPLTPRLISTVFARPGIHIHVFLLLALCNLLYFLFLRGVKVAIELYGPEAQDEIDVLSDSLQLVKSFTSRLLTWLLAGYLANIVTIYYRDVRAKAGGVMSALSNFVGTMSITINYESARAEEFLEEMHGALNGIGHYALAHASSNTKFRLSKKEMQDIFNERGYDGAYLLSLVKKETVTVLYLGILQTLQEESERSDGCLKSFDSVRFGYLRRDLEQLLGSALSTISCMSSNKLPYAYHQLLHWGTKVFLFIYTALAYVAAAQEHGKNGQPYPFTCFELGWKMWNGCTTEEFIWYNVTNMLNWYFLLGCLEMYPVLAKTWEHSLVVKNYGAVVDLICLPLKPKSTSTGERSGRQKSLRQLRLK